MDNIMTVAQTKKIFTLQINQLKRLDYTDSQIKDYLISYYNFTTKDLEYLIILEIIEESNVSKV